MVSTMQLLIPALVSAVGVFFASSLVHMVFKWHNSDYRKLPNEDDVSSAIRKSGVGPGLYTLPHCADMKQMQQPEMQKKFREGPVAWVIVHPTGLPNMGKHLGLWFALNLFVAGIAACICGTVFGPNAAQGSLFHVAGLVGFAAYGCGSISDGIWYGRPWSAVAKDMLDSAIYGLITGASFALLWPH